MLRKFGIVDCGLIIKKNFICDLRTGILTNLPDFQNCRMTQEFAVYQFADLFSILFHLKNETYEIQRMV
jgi:hypothetical protein